MIRITSCTILLFSSAIFFTVSASAATMGAPDKWHNCRVTEVMEFSSRIHVKCSNPVKQAPNTIAYISIGTGNKDKANRFMSLATTAIVSGIELRVKMSGDPKKNPPGCNFSDCRYPARFGLRK